MLKLLEFPFEIISSIYFFCDFPTIGRLASTCKKLSHYKKNNWCNYLIKKNSLINDRTFIGDRCIKHKINNNNFFVDDLFVKIIGVNLFELKSENLIDNWFNWYKVCIDIYEKIISKKNHTIIFMLHPIKKHNNINLHEKQIIGFIEYEKWLWVCVFNGEFRGNYVENGDFLYVISKILSTENIREIIKI